MKNGLEDGKRIKPLFESSLRQCALALTGSLVEVVRSFRIVNQERVPSDLMDHANYGSSFPG